MDSRNEWAYRFRGVLMSPLYLVALFVEWGEVNWKYIAWPLGLAVFFLGVAVRVWAQMHLHYRLRVHKTLTDTGPYAYVRNPIYIANTVMLLGLAIFTGLIWFTPIVLAWCILVYRAVVRREEAHLTLKYGQPYVAYLNRVGRWMPHWCQRGENVVEVSRFFMPSLLAESHCLLLLIPLVGKELFLKLAG